MQNAIAIANNIEKLTTKRSISKYAKKVAEEIFESTGRAKDLQLFGAIFGFVPKRTRIHITRDSKTPIQETDPESRAKFERFYNRVMDNLEPPYKRTINGILETIEDRLEPDDESAITKLDPKTDLEDLQKALDCFGEYFVYIRKKDITPQDMTKESPKKLSDRYPSGSKSFRNRIKALPEKYLEAYRENAEYVIKTAATDMLTEMWESRSRVLFFKDFDAVAEETELLTKKASQISGYYKLQNFLEKQTNAKYKSDDEFVDALREAVMLFGKAGKRLYGDEKKDAVQKIASFSKKYLLSEGVEIKDEEYERELGFLLEKESIDDAYNGILEMVNRIKSQPVIDLIEKSDKYTELLTDALKAFDNLNLYTVKGADPKIGISERFKEIPLNYLKNQAINVKDRKHIAKAEELTDLLFKNGIFEGPEEYFKFKEKIPTLAEVEYLSVLLGEISGLITSKTINARRALTGIALFELYEHLLDKGLEGKNKSYFEELDKRRNELKSRHLLKSEKGLYLLQTEKPKKLIDCLSDKRDRNKIYSIIDERIKDETDFKFCISVLGDYLNKEYGREDINFDNFRNVKLIGDGKDILEDTFWDDKKFRILMDYLRKIDGGQEIKTGEMDSKDTTKAFFNYIIKESINEGSKEVNNLKNKHIVYLGGKTVIFVALAGALDAIPYTITSELDDETRKLYSETSAYLQSKGVISSDLKIVKGSPYSEGPYKVLDTELKQIDDFVSPLRSGKIKFYIDFFDSLIRSGKKGVKVTLFGRSGSVEKYEDLARNYVNTPLSFSEVTEIPHLKAFYATVTKKRAL